MSILHWKCSRMFLYNCRVFLLSCFSFPLPHRSDLILSWNFIPGTAFTFLWPNNIFLYKGKMAMTIFCFESYRFDNKLFLYIAYFSPFNLKSLLNQKLSSLKAEFCFCDWQINVSIFSNVFRLQLPLNR